MLNFLYNFVITHIYVYVCSFNFVFLSVWFKFFETVFHLSQAGLNSLVGQE